MDKYCCILVTVPSEDLAEKISHKLVSDKLVACVNIVPGLRSIYHWKGEICDDKELLLVMKTCFHRFEKIKEQILSLHNYDTPEIIAIPISAGYEAYLEWISDTVLQ